jgi:hypothetical protein
VFNREIFGIFGNFVVGGNREDCREIAVNSGFYPGKPGMYTGWHLWWCPAAQEPGGSGAGEDAGAFGGWRGGSNHVGWPGTDRVSAEARSAQAEVLGLGLPDF